MNARVANSIHYVVQGVGLASGQNSSSSRSSSRSGRANAGSGNYISNGAYEEWLNFPQGPDGPLLLRSQRWNMDQTSKQCGWLQNGVANYYYHSGENKVYLTNDPVGMLILPTDPPELVAFIRKHLKHHNNVEYSYDSRKNLMTRK